MEAEMDVKATVESKGSATWWLAAWALCALVVVLQMIQQQFGLGLTMRLPIEAKRMVKENDVYEWRLPHRYRNPVMVHRAVLVENGWPLQRAERVSTFMEQKNGWFNVYRDLTRFYPADGSDPRSNGKKYEMIVPKQYEGRELWVPWVILVFLSFMVARTGAPGTSLPAVRGEYAWVFLVSLVIAVLRVWTIGLYSDGVFTVGGIPESDASGWFQHAQGLSEGWGITTGFSGQRPFYGVLMSPLFLLPGDPIAWIKGLHCLLWAAGAAGLYALGVSLSGRLAGIACAFALMAGETHIPHVMAVLTENPGVSLAIIAALALWRAFRDQSLWMIAAAGLLMGFGNLAAGATLFAIPALAILILIYAWVKLGMKQAILWAGVFTVAVSSIFLPWMIRQKIVLGTFSPSLNSGTLLRGGADPVRKHMWPGMHEEPIQAGIPAGDEAGQYKFHMDIFKKLVAEDPVHYVKQVASAWYESFEYFRITDPGFRLAGLLFLGALGLLAVWKRGDVAGIIVAILLAIGWTLLDRSMVLTLLAASTAILLAVCWKDVRFWLIIVLIMNLGAGSVLAGMAGNQTSSRMWQVMDWAAFLLILGAMQQVWQWLTTALGRLIPFKIAGDSTATISEPPHHGTRLIWASVAVCLATSVFAIGRTVIGPGTRATVAITDAQKAEILARVAKEHPDPLVRSATTLTVSSVRLTHRRFLQAAGYDTAHWMTHYARRDYDRWDLAPERADISTSPDKRGFGAARARGDIADIPANEPVIFVALPSAHTFGLNDAPYRCSDAVAIIPWKDGAPDWTRIRWMQRCPD